MQLLKTAVHLLILAIWLANHTMTIAYSGDDRYAPFSKDTILNVPKVDIPDKDVSISVDFALGVNSPRFLVQLPYDATGYVVLSINNVSYYAEVNDGIATVNVANLPYGTYDVNVKYSGNGKYNSLTKNTTVKVSITRLSTINISIRYLTNYNYKVRLYIDGKAAAKKYVTFQFNGKTYKRLTDARGYATLTLPKVNLKNTLLQ